MAYMLSKNILNPLREIKDFAKDYQPMISLMRLRLQGEMSLDKQA